MISMTAEPYWAMMIAGRGSCKGHSEVHDAALPHAATSTESRMRVSMEAGQDLGGCQMLGGPGDNPVAHDAAHCNPVGQGSPQGSWHLQQRPRAVGGSLPSTASRLVFLHCLGWVQGVAACRGCLLKTAWQGPRPHVMHLQAALFSEGRAMQHRAGQQQSLGWR